MTETEIRRLLGVLRAEYGTKVSCSDERVTLWSIVLGHASYTETQVAIAELLSEPRAFPPSVGEINAAILANRRGGKDDWSSAWDAVLFAGKRSLYYAEEEAARLAPEALKAIGGVPGLKELAHATSDQLGVLRAQFRQRYETVEKRAESDDIKAALQTVLPSVHIRMIK